MVYSLEPLKPILPADAQEITSPFLFVKEIIILLKEAWICASPIASTFTFLFNYFSLFCHDSNDYLLAFFLLATVFLFPLRVLELFFVLWPLKGNPSL